MTARGPKWHREPWREVLLDELTDETEDERRDFTDPGRNAFESEHGPVMGSDADDSPECTATPKPKFDGEKLERGDINDPVQAHAAENLPGQMVAAAHGFIVNDPRSRPWKTARRTHCAFCGGSLPEPDVGGYRCELDPDADAPDTALIGTGQGPQTWPLTEECSPRPREGRWHSGCQCSGCVMRWLVANGHERNRGQPPKCCSAECKRLRDNERKRWRTAVARAEKRRQEPPPEPEDRGLKLIQRQRVGPRSNIEGSGHRYVAATGLPWKAPRA